CATTVPREGLAYW
nr:immunoglobulin heavy chain junction region [Mus musculus]